MPFVVGFHVYSTTSVWSRVVCVDAIPDKTDLFYYYSMLLGLPVVSIDMEAIEVPPSFQMNLLPQPVNPQTMFPIHALETPAAEHEKRTQFMEYIRNVVQIERSRATLFPTDIVITGDGGGATGGAASRPNLSSKSRAMLHRGREWVNELLHTLDPDSDDEYAADALVSATAAPTDTHVPIGWVFTPVNGDARKTHGSRICVNSALGQTWERLLGTELYPDLIVSRRLSSHHWAFQHPTSEALLRATVDWYLASQDAVMTEGLSNWIRGAELDLHAIVGTFKKVKIHDKLLAEQVQQTDTQSQVFVLLNQVENQLLQSATENSFISPCSHGTFMRYLTSLYRAHAIDKDAPMDRVEQHVQRWVRSNYGFRAGVDPLVAAWTELWSVIMRGNPTHERVIMFLNTLGAWDPLAAVTYTPDVKSRLAADWIQCYMDSEIVADPEEGVMSTVLYTKCNEWCTKYLPISVFPTHFTSMTIAPVFTRNGFNSVKKYGGRITTGIKFKDTSIPKPSLRKRVNPRKKSETATAAPVAAAAEPAVTAVSEIDLGRI